MYKASPIGKILILNENESYDMYQNAILQRNLFVTAYDYDNTMIVIDFLIHVLLLHLHLCGREVWTGYFESLCL